MRIELRDLAGFLSEARLELSEDGAPDHPVTVINLDGGVVEDRTIVALEDAIGRVFVGAASGPPPAELEPLVAALDLTLVASAGVRDRHVVAVDDLDAEISAICGAIGRNPRAALALTGLLRITERLPVVQGLLAESAVYSMLLAGPEFARWRARRPVRPLPLYERSPVGLRREGNVLHVTLDRPQRRNAFDRQMRDGLVDALDLVLVDPSIARVQLTGAGPAFCSGGDLDEFGTATDVTVAHLIRLERSVAARIARCRDRVSVHLHGACVGAGVELPAFAGAVSAEPDTMMSLPELRMGLVPGAGGTVGITRRIGRWRTAYLALRGEPLDAATACDWGLVDQVTS
jgi:enoyl-CoA hydratase/carnithine racemase